MLWFNRQAMRRIPKSVILLEHYQPLNTPAQMIEPAILQLRQPESFHQRSIFVSAGFVLKNTPNQPHTERTFYLFIFNILFLRRRPLFILQWGNLQVKISV